MSGQYILDENGQPVPCHDLMEWGRFMEQKGVRQVAIDMIGDADVSTVFLGLDHAFGGGPPVLWETMIFGGKHDGYQERYTSRNRAIVGHQKALEMVKATR